MVRSIVLGTVILAMGCAGRVESSEPSGDRVSPGLVREGGGPELPADASIFRIRRPGNGVAAGTRVHLDGSTLQVTAQANDRLWIQEAGDRGGCESSPDLVAYRAIAVVSAEPLPELVRGQRVVVDGVVADEGGTRSLALAHVVAVGAPSEPYAPHCDRNLGALEDNALDAVLVMTAGDASGATLIPGAPWTLQTCGVPDGPRLPIDASLVGQVATEPTWQWVTGVLDRRSGASHLVPRDADDVRVTHHDDVCL